MIIVVGYLLYSIRYKSLFT